MIKFFTICLCLNFMKQGTADETSRTVTEVSAGNLAELPCLSNDDFHRFMFWQLTDDRYIIGPGNPPNENKYNYEVLTGKLYIREVSIAEAGFYKCVSRGIENSSVFNIHIVELVVKTNMQELVENSFETNLLRSMALIMVIVVSIAIILLLFMLNRRRAQQNLFDLLDESLENSPNKYVNNMQFKTVNPTPKTPQTGTVDNMGFDVDFPKMFQQIQKETAMPF